MPSHTIENYSPSLANGVLVQWAKAVICQATHPGSNPLETEISNWDQVKQLGNFDRNVPPLEGCLLVRTGHWLCLIYSG